ncbi:MAG: hypothetical protein H6735_27215 [Alphaproteobacteria bacterium]|nr:hypothetical protein [Alphaproteobacteria bacterium]
MVRLRNPWFVLALGGVLVLAGAAAAFSGPGERWRRWRWTTIAQTPLDDQDRAALAACDAVAGWEVWLKVLQSAPDLPCGEAWAATGLAQHAEHELRATWMAEAAAGGTVDTRMRVATGLLLAGHTPAEEPAWLWHELPERSADAWIAATSVQPVALQLGPAVDALATVNAMAPGDPELAAGVPLLRWLASTEDPRAVAEVEEAVTRLTQVDAALAKELADRGARGLPVGRPPIPGRSFLAAGCTGETCLPERLAVLDAILADPGEGPPPSPVEPPSPDPELERLVGEDAPLLGWQLLALQAWIAAAPDPDARLASLLARPATGPLARLAWDGSGPPYVVALLATRLRSPSPVVRSDRADAVLVELGERSVLRTCTAGTSAGDGWPALGPDPLLARAWMELAEDEPSQRAWVRARARRLDPSLAAPEPTGDPLAFRIGAMLAPPPADATFADQGWCGRQ